MRSLGLSLVLGVTPLLLAGVPSEAVAQRARPMMMSPSRPMMAPFRPGMGMIQPGMGMSQSMMSNPFASSQMMYGGSGMYGMSSGGYSPYQISYGSSGMSAMPSDGYSPYQTPYSSYYSSSGSYAPSRASQVPRVPTADDIEVSGPLDTPPPRRAIIRLRLPHTWDDVSFDGLKVDSMGQARTFVTPELPGARTFEVTATWKNKGRTSFVQEQVTVRAGQIRTLDFKSGN